MITFLQTILIVLLVYYGLKILIKWLTPYFLRYLTRKASEKFGNAFGSGPYQTNQSQKEGKITVDKMPHSNNNSKSTVGEYVDYEEID